MGKTILSDYKNIYLQTANEYIGKMLISLDKLTKDVLDKEALNDLHISSHSLRSQSQVMEIMEIGKLAGSIEKKSKDILNGSGKIDSAFLFSLKESINELYLKLSKI